jgi:hypothetical protein
VEDLNGSIAVVNNVELPPRLLETRRRGLKHPRVQWHRRLVSLTLPRARCTTATAAPANSVISGRLWQWPHGRNRLGGESDFLCCCTFCDSSKELLCVLDELKAAHLASAIEVRLERCLGHLFDVCLGGTLGLDSDGGRRAVASRGGQQW